MWDALLSRPAQPRSYLDPGPMQRPPNRCCVHTKMLTKRGERPAIGIEPNGFCGSHFVKTTYSRLHPGSREQPSNRAAVDLETLGKVADPSASLVGQDQIVHLARLEPSLNLPHQALHQDFLARLTVVMAGQIRQCGV
jgi:hypothetical protein